MIPGIFDNPAVLMMGWALLHFLWQGTLIALALKGALMLVEQRSSRLRYAFALVCLFLMAASPVFLLCKRQSKNSETTAVYEAVQFEMATATGSASDLIPIQRKPDFRAAFFHFVTPMIPWIAACWVLGAALMLLKTMGGIIQVGLLKKKIASHCETKRMSLLHRLAARARVADVPLLESDLVSVPTVAGWFRPLVLLPKGVLKKMDRPMLDALVAHELAHIRRHDCVMNLLQTLIEDLLFFHPAMWWVTKSVRAEREACCDDDAVSICGDALVYVRALSQAEQFRSSLPIIALSSSPLLQRIRRLTEMRIPKMNHFKALCVALLAVSSIIVTAAGSILLAPIPPQNSKSSVSVRTSGGNQDFDKTKSETRRTQLQIGSKYALLCGIISGGTVDKATGKPVPLPPPPKDEKDGMGGCLLLDVSTPKSSRVNGELQASKLIHKVDPVFPASAIAEHIGIRVLLHLELNEEGVVTDAGVIQMQTIPPDRDSQGNWVGGAQYSVINGIRKTAINAVKQWKFSPTLLNGKAIPVRATVSINFTFTKDGSPKIITYAL
jgi:beta-lactamase regulating signal transducer with metallopeptidase domain